MITGQEITILTERVRAIREKHEKQQKEMARLNKITFMLYCFVSICYIIVTAIHFNKGMGGVGVIYALIALTFAAISVSSWNIIKSTHTHEIK